MNKRLEPAMNSLLTLATLLALIALTDGSLEIAIPGVTGPTINRGLN